MDEKIQDRMNYFPFTHGELLETQRKQIKENMKVELQENYKARVKAMEE